jgi:hypothetical protein
MKKILLILFVISLSAGSVFAQPGDPAARLQREIEGLTAALGLNADEVAKITPIVTEGQKKLSEAFAKMRESGEMDREKMRETRTKIMGETDKALKAVLTPAQGVKLDEFRKKQEEERAKRMQQRQQ